MYFHSLPKQALTIGFSFVAFSTLIAAQGDRELQRNLGRYSTSQRAVPIHDFNGDAIPDILHSEPNDSTGGFQAGKIQILSGADGTALFTLHGNGGDFLGSGICGMEDQTGDQIPDFVVTARGWDGGKGKLSLFSGSDGSVVKTLTGNSLNQKNLGVSVFPVGDLDGDGIKDISFSGRTDKIGHLTFYSLANDYQMFQINHVDTAQDAGDTTGDGIDDLLIYVDFVSTVSLHSGATGLQLWETWYQSQAPMPIEDRNGNGLPDVALFHYNGTDYHLKWVDGATGQDLRSGVNLFPRGFTQSWATNDLDGDGFRDMLTRTGAGIAAISTHSGDIMWLDSNLGKILGSMPDMTGNQLSQMLCNGRGYDLLLVNLLPGLKLSRDTLSASSSDTVQFEINYSDRYSRHRYAILASTATFGLTQINDFKIMLGWSSLLNHTMSGKHIPGSSPFWGRLDAHGDATATLTASTALAPYIGTSVQFCAVLYDYLGVLPIGENCSIPQSLQILP
ncbi:MAG: hypothetical protein H8E15_04725 [Planctomycetes bacterium]|nr:hypothetical protein [Planctomycetota bacterium]